MPDPTATPAAARGPFTALLAGRDSLAADLRAHVRGEVQFTPGDRALYSTDSSNYRQLPIGVVRPLDTDDLAETIRVCRDHEAPVTLRGGGTSLAGQATNGAVVVDVSRHLNRIVELDPERRIARVQPGVILDDLRAAAERHHLTFGPDPATHDRCTLGGMLGNDSCGAHSIMAGRTSDNVESLDVLTYDGLRLTVGRTTDEELARICAETGPRGEIYRSLRSLRDRHAALIRERYPKLPRLVSGFPLQALLPENGFDVARSLVGTEGTCVTILEATVRLVAQPARSSAAGARLPRHLRGGRPIARDHDGRPDRPGRVRRSTGRGLPAQGAEPGGDRRACRRAAAGCWSSSAARRPREAESKARAAAERFGGRGSARVVVDAAEQEALWTLRESAVGATAVVPGKPSTYPGWEDSAVPPGSAGRLHARARRADRPVRLRAHLLRPLRRRLPAPALRVRLPHARRVCAPSAPSSSRRPTWSFGTAAPSRASTATARPGRSCCRACSGRSWSAAFREFKSIWDPHGRMNPGKVVDPAAARRGPAAGPDAGPTRGRSSASPTTAARWPGPWRGASAWASAAASRAGRCARRSRPRTRSATRPAAGPACCGRCSRARRCRTCGAATRCSRPWTCASPARAARAIARSGWTSPRTRPSSWPTTTPAGSGRGPPTRWA